MHLGQELLQTALSNCETLRSPRVQVKKLCIRCRLGPVMASDDTRSVIVVVKSFASDFPCASFFHSLLLEQSLSQHLLLIYIMVHFTKVLVSSAVLAVAHAHGVVVAAQGPAGPESVGFRGAPISRLHP